MKEGFNMSFDFSCPISGEQRDNNTVRLVAGFVFIIAGVALVAAFMHSTHVASIITGILAFDFIIRAFVKPKYSPLATLARGIVSGRKLPPKMVDSAPKVFAARIGVVFTVVSTILYGVGLVYAGSIVLVILLVCAGLEFFFSFCLGCFMYSLLPKKLGNVLSREFIIR